MDKSSAFEQIMAKKQEQAILNNDQIIILDETYNFSETTLLFGDAVSVYIPDEFVLMSEEWVKEKYPYINRPEIIYTNKNGTINFTFDFMETDSPELSDEDVLKILLGMRSSIKKMNPANTFYDIQAETGSAWFDFRSYAIDGKLYNIIFAVNMGNKLLLGSFSCPFDMKEDYELFARRIILSIVPNENEVENNAD